MCNDYPIMICLAYVFVTSRLRNVKVYLSNNRDSSDFFVCAPERQTVRFSVVSFLQRARVYVLTKKNGMHAFLFPIANGESIAAYSFEWKKDNNIFNNIQKISFIDEERSSINYPYGENLKSKNLFHLAILCLFIASLL